MPLIKDPVTNLLKQALGFANLRQDVIASNIANANTPGYKAFDLVLRSSMGAPASLEPIRSSQRHMAMDATPSSPSGAHVERSREPGRLDGNNVNLDEELMKMLENRVNYRAAMEFYDRWGKLKQVARQLR